MDFKKSEVSSPSIDYDSHSVLCSTNVTIPIIHRVETELVPDKQMFQLPMWEWDLKIRGKTTVNGLLDTLKSVHFIDPKKMKTFFPSRSYSIKDPVTKSLKCTYFYWNPRTIFH